MLLMVTTPAVRHGWLFYDGGPSSSLRKKRTSIRRSIASGLFSIRSASSMSSGFTEMGLSIFPFGDSSIIGV